jgi:hypothetical protein
MVNTRITSFIMAVTMALWSPGWCCCSVVVGSELSSSACAAPTVPHNQFESAATREVNGHCLAILATESLTGAAGVASSSSCCEPSPGSSTPNDDPSSCGCGNHSRDANVGRVAVLPIPGEVDFQVLETMAWTPAMVVPSVARFGLQASTARAGRGLPCADSLLLRHCLLTI